MADPRAAAGFEGINAEYATFTFDSTIVYSSSQRGGSASVGLAVTVVGNGQVGLAEDGEIVIGKLIRVESDICTVQVGGAMTLPAGDGATVTAGVAIVGALGAASAKGYIRNVVTATTPTAAQVNEVAKARGTILDAATSTAVAVLL
jgi:hypothetical protein